MSLPHVTIYTDGGCRPNPGPGGWGALLIFDETEQVLSGGEADTTNNRMELIAVCEALDSLATPHAIDLYTDSQYVKNGITRWINGWIKRRWQGVKNPQLWQRLHQATQRHEITWHWVKGHAGVEANERVDQLASAEINKLHQQLGLDKAPAPNSDIQIYTIASGYQDRLRGKWAAVIVTPDGERQMRNRDTHTTVNRLLLSAAIEILTTLDPGSTIDYYTDSEYLQRGMTQWLDGWIEQGWKTASGKPVKNQDLWEALHRLRQSYNVTWHFSRDNPYAETLKQLVKQQEKS